MKYFPLTWAFLAFSASCLADILPSDRVYPWSVASTVGVPGGIPTRTTIFTNMTGLDNTGATDVSAAIEAALAACPSNQVVYIPEGSFKLTGDIKQSTKNNVTLRGAGIGRTVFVSYITNLTAAMQFGSADSPAPQPSVSISAGATAGSSNVTVSTLGAIALGKFVRIGQSTPDYVFTTGSATNLQNSMHLVTATNATSVTFWPPLPLTLTNNPSIATYASIVKGIGLEDFSIDLNNSDGACGLYLLQTWGSWIENVEIYGSDTRQMFLLGFSMGEIRDCYTHGTRGSGPGFEGIDLQALCCWNLVENNSASSGGFPAFILGDGGGGCVGNVVAYNWADHTDSGSTVSGAAFSVNHGPHNMFNLFEGNVGEMFQADGYFGSASHNTIFRNNFTGTFASSNIWERAVDLCRWSYYFNAAANVLGSADQSFTYSTTNANFSGPLIYRLGFPNMGNMGYTGSNPPTTNWAGLDAKVEETVLLVANYDYATAGIVNPTNDIPASLYRSSAPSFMSGYNWPAIGSDLTPMVSRIPAQDRFTQRRATAGTVNVGTLNIGN